MGIKKQIHFLKRSDDGQSTVEYILLLAMVIGLTFTIFNSRAFKNFLGKDSNFFKVVAERIQMNYRYASRIPLADDIGSAPTADHPSFARDSSTSRFFGYKDGQDYPAN